MARKVIDNTNLPHLVEAIRKLIPGLATEEAPGLMPALSGNEDEVLLGTGAWGEHRGGGGGAGLLSFEVRDGRLIEFYDDGMGDPGVSLKTDGPLAGHLVWAYDDGR